MIATIRSRRRSTRCGVAAFLSTLTLTVLGCDFRAPTNPEPSEPTRTSSSGLTGGKLVFRADFEDGELAAATWNNTGGDHWKVKDGELTVSDARNGALWLNKPLPKQVRVEFDATSDSPDGDIKCEIFGDGNKHESGYIVIFGGWKNAINVIARLDEHGDDRLVGAHGKKVVQGQTYRMAIVRTDDELRWFVDGEPMITYADKKPLTGAGHHHFAFNNWVVPLRFDNLEVYDLGAASR